MCHDPDSKPPIVPAPDRVASTAPLTLISADGATIPAFLARPVHPSGVGLLVLPDMRGVHPYYEQLAARIAEHGHTALAMDYFGRTAGVGARGDDFPFMQHIMRVTRQTIDDDIEATVRWLRAAEGGGCRTVLALGFCFGGRQALFASSPRFGLSGVVSFYGAPSFYPNAKGAPGPAQRAAELRAPILALWGGADEGIPAGDVQAFDEALTKHNVEHEFVTYPNMPHGFFEQQHVEYAEACADAWQRVLAFVERRSS